MKGSDSAVSGPGGIRKTPVIHCCPTGGFGLAELEPARVGHVSVVTGSGDVYLTPH